MKMGKEERSKQILEKYKKGKMAPGPSDYQADAGMFKRSFN